MAEESTPSVLVCACGQKMKIPRDAHGKAFKCVRCGARVTASDENTRRGGDDAAPSAKPPERVGQLLIEEGLISPEQLDHALGVQCEQGGKTFEILMALGYLDKDALHAFLSRQQGVATIDLSRFSIDRDLVRLIPRKMALEQFVLPIDRLGKLLTVAMACPLDAATIGEMEKITQLKVKAVLCKLDDLKAAVDKYYRDPNDPADAAAGFALFGNLPARVRFDPAEALERLESLPVAEAAAAALAAAAGGDAPSPVAMVEAAAGDPALAAALLRAANCAAYGMARDVDNLALAVALLGADGVRQVVMDAPRLPDGDDPANMVRARARLVAETARAIAKTGGNVAPGVAYTAGLLQGVGAVALHTAVPEKYRYVSAAEGLGGLREAEARVFTMAHPEAGAALATHWGLPARLASALRHQDDPAGAAEAAPLATVLAAAVALVDAGEGASGETLAGLRAALADAGYSAEAALKAARAA